MDEERNVQPQRGQPVRSRRKKKYKILWDRVIVALVALIAVIVGIVMLISALVGAIKGALKKDDSSSAVKAQAPVVSSQQEVPESVVQPDDGTLFTVVIDAGHGGEDVGSTDFDGVRYEKEDCLRVAKLVEKHLKDMNVKVIMTRSEDVYVTLDDRCKIANESNAVVFVSLHRNYFDEEAQGVEVWVHNEKPETDTALAQNILDGLKGVGITQDRGVNFGYRGNEYVNYQVNRETNMPSCLVELGFMQDEQDNKLFDDNCDAYAKAIADAIYKTVKERELVKNLP